MTANDNAKSPIVIMNVNPGSESVLRQSHMRSVCSLFQERKRNYNALADHNADVSCCVRRRPLVITVALYNKSVFKSSGYEPIHVHVAMPIGHVAPGRIHCMTNGAGKHTDDASLPGLTPEGMQCSEEHNWS